MTNFRFDMYLFHVNNYCYWSHIELDRRDYNFSALDNVNYEAITNEYKYKYYCHKQKDY